MKKLSLLIIFVLSFFSCGDMMFDCTLEFKTNITYRDNVQMFKDASLSNDFRHLQFDIFEYPKNFTEIYIYKTAEEAQGINIEENFFDNYILGIVVIDLSGSKEWRNSKIYSKNGNLTFSVDRWRWRGRVQTDEISRNILFLKIPK